MIGPFACSVVDRVPFSDLLRPTEGSTEVPTNAVVYWHDEVELIGPGGVVAWSEPVEVQLCGCRSGASGCPVLAIAGLGWRRRERR